MSVPAGARDAAGIEALDPGPPAPVAPSPFLTPPPAQHPSSASVSPSRRPPRRRGPYDVHPRPGHIPGLDGIRALAIIGVLIYHFTPTALPGGFLGVDVFFVLSGFLITTLLLRDVADHGRIRLGDFWLRRARRLLPALVVVVVVSIGTARLVGGDLLVAIGRQALGALTFSTNWLEINAGASYFHHTSPQLFVNFWSLAVEEQFYLLWPLLLGVLLAVTSTTRQRLIFALGVTAASALAMALLYTPGEDATRVYYGTDTHVFALMLGVALAFAWASRQRAWLRTTAWQRWRGLAVTAALVVLVALMRTLSDASAWTFRGGILLACLATVVLIAGLLESPGPWRRVMQVAPLVWLGRRSYGIYLWHWPVVTIMAAVFPFADGTPRGALVLLAALAITFAVAETSYRLIEMPVRRQGFRTSVRRALTWIATPWQDSKVPRLVAGLSIAAVLMAAVGAVTAPDRSRTEQAIIDAESSLNDPPAAPAEEAEQDGSEAPGPAPEVPGGTPEDSGNSEPDNTPDPPDGAEPGGASAVVDTSGWSQDEDGLLVPDGDQITAIGDSLVVTSADGLKYRFEGMNFLAQSNRQWKDAGAVVQQGLDDGLIRDQVVLHFGTNAGVDEQALRTVLDALGEDRAIVLMNLYSRSTFVPGSNQTLAQVAADYPNVVLGDWNAAATAEPQTLQSDRIHPDIAGMHVYARVVAESFDVLANGG